MTDAKVERVARALSIPQHHTTWDTLTWQEKDLFYMQAEYAITALEQSDAVMGEAVKGANGQDVRLLEIDGRTVEVDAEIADLVRVLNENGYPTRASCAGHDRLPGSIVLRDGRVIVIARDLAELKRIEALFPSTPPVQDDDAGKLRAFIRAMPSEWDIERALLDRIASHLEGLRK